MVKPTTAGPGVDLAAAALRGEPVAPNVVLAPRSFPDLADLQRGR